MSYSVLLWLHGYDLYSGNLVVFSSELIENLTEATLQQKNGLDIISHKQLLYEDIDNSAFAPMRFQLRNINNLLRPPHPQEKDSGLPTSNLVKPTLHGIHKVAMLTTAGWLWSSFPLVGLFSS